MTLAPKPLRIGVLSRPLDRLEAWELRILDAIDRSQWGELSLFVTDGRPHRRGDRIRRVRRAGNVLGRAMFAALSRAEARTFPSPPFDGREALLERLRRVPTIALRPKRRGYVDHFDAPAIDPLRPFDLDILLRHEFNIIKGALLALPRHGVWSFHHADNRVNRGAPPAFWEIVLGQPFTGVTLQRLTPELDGGEVIARATGSTQWSLGRNYRLAKELGVVLLLRELRRLAETGSFVTEAAQPYSGPLYRAPRPSAVARYALAVTGRVASIVAGRLRETVGVRSNYWELRHGTGRPLEAALWRAKPIEAPRGRFWADPFVLEHDGLTHVFFEDYDYRLGRARISVGTLHEGRLQNVRTALARDYHLSYPFVFRWGSDVFMMPETIGARRLEVWRAEELPARWVLHATAFEGEAVADPTLHVDRDGKAWLFVSRTESALGHLDAELHVYAIDGPDLRSITPHRLNPVKIDTRSARGAGPIFADDDGRPIRPAQTNAHGVYGYGMSLQRIDRLSLDAFAETTVGTITPDFEPGLIGTHHLCPVPGGGYLIDVCHRRRW